MPKYRKKPIVIEAEQFALGRQPLPEGVIPIVVDPHDGRVLGEYPGPEGNAAFGIKTLEGWHVVMHGDYVITGVKGERYPCKPDIFEATYDLVEEPVAPHPG